MIKVFKDNVRGVFAGVYCAAMMVCGAEVSGMMVSGRDMRSKIGGTESHFRYFLDGERSRIPENWPKVLANISADIDYLLSDQCEKETFGYVRSFV
jgi:hypothetical protein